MRVFYARHKKTRELLHFEGEVLIANTRGIFEFLMEVNNDKVSIRGQRPFNIEDYEIVEISGDELERILSECGGG